MDAGDFLEAIIMGVALEWEREKTSLMEESLRDAEVALRKKELERSTLIGKKEGMLAEIKAKEKLIADFMVFIGAYENNDLEIAQNFDEKAMMNAVVTMMDGVGNYGFNDGGFDGQQKGGGNTDLEIAQNPDEAVMVSIEGAGSGDGEGSNAGGKGGSCDGDRRK